MTTYVNALQETAWRPRRLADWGKNLAGGLIWAREMQSRCQRAAAAGGLDYDTLRRIAAEVEASGRGR